MGGSYRFSPHRPISQCMKGWCKVGKISIARDWKKENPRRKNDSSKKVRMKGHMCGTMKNLTHWQVGEKREAKQGMEGVGVVQFVGGLEHFWREFNLIG